MKNLIILMSLVFFTSCGGVKTSSSGLETESYLEFIGNPHQYIGGVVVSVDDVSTFNAEVFNAKTNRVKGKVYAISPGQHDVSVTYKSNLILKKQIYISTQETKKIVLP